MVEGRNAGLNNTRNSALYCTRASQPCIRRVDLVYSPAVVYSLCVDYKVASASQNKRQKTDLYMSG